MNTTATRTITKDAIFDYVYGVLHAPSYRVEFENDLSKELPRIPFAPDFYVQFAEAGKTLGELHLGYERCERYPLEVVFAHEGEPQARHFRLTEKAMRFADDEKTTLRINEHVSVCPAYRRRRIGTSSMGGRRWSGILIGIGLSGTRRAGLSTIRTGGLRIRTT